MKIKILVVLLVFSLTSNAFAAWGKYEKLEDCVLIFVRISGSSQAKGDEQLEKYYVNLSAIKVIEEDRRYHDRLQLDSFELNNLNEKTKEKIINRWMKCVK